MPAKKKANRSSNFDGLKVPALLLILIAVPLTIWATYNNNLLTFAAKGSKGGGTSTSGSCSVSPNPVAVGANYTLVGSNLGANAIVNVLITDSGATTSWNLQADASGTTTLTWHSYWSGTTNVTFQESSRHGSTTVASCSFSVI